jgi:undecaprenyl diphosphate synthase
MPDVDLLIRTDGEQLISNFLLCQATSAESPFANALWPEFDEFKLNKALHWYASRKPLFRSGGLVVEIKIENKVNDYCCCQLSQIN